MCLGNHRLSTNQPAFSEQRAVHADARRLHGREQYVGGEGEVAQRRRQAPHLHIGPPMNETRERELRLRAPLVAKQLMPLVDDHEAHVCEYFARVGPRERSM